MAAKSPSLSHPRSVQGQSHRFRHGRTALLLLLLGSLSLLLHAQPAVTSPAPGAVLPGASATFTWTAQSTVAQYQLWLGTNGAGSGNLGVYSAGSTTASSVSITAAGLPTNGATIYARLFYDVQGDWIANDYTYTAASPVVALSALSCPTASFTGAGSDACTVTLSKAAPTGGTTVALASNNSAVTVPASVSVAAAATTASFTAKVAAVTTAQSATVTASAGGVSKASAITLKPTAPALKLSSATVAFGSVALNTPATQSITLTSSGTAPLTISSLSLTGTGFSASGITTPLTLNPGATATLSVKFDPTAAGAASGSIAIASNAATQTIALSGSGASSTPVITSPAPGSVLPGTSATFTWTAGSGVSTYQLWLGTTGVGSGNIGVYSAGSTTASTISVSVTGLPTGSATVYARLFYVVNGNWLASDYTYTESSGAAALGAVSCSTTSFTAAGSDACKVTLTAAAPSAGFAVSLASNNSAVTIPASVSVASGATSASFTATVSAVTAAKTVTITATAGSASTTTSLQLAPAAPALTLSATGVAFGTVQVNSPATQSITLSSTGNSAVTISSLAVAGTGFSASGISAPLTLNPGAKATLNLEFDPTVAGAASGSITIAGNTATQTIALSGTGSSTTYGVDLSWEAPSGSSMTIVGYNVYRSSGTSSSYQLLNSSVNAPTSFTDSTVQCAQNYSYIVTTVDSEGMESLPSNSIEVSVP